MKQIQADRHKKMWGARTFTPNFDTELKQELKDITFIHTPNIKIRMSTV